MKNQQSQDDWLVPFTDSGSSSGGTRVKVRGSWADQEDTPSEGDRSSNGIESSSKSVGSLTHSTATCQPCVFHSSLLGCRQAASCSYCHLSHPAVRRKPGLRKNRRERIEERIRGHFKKCQELQELHEILQAEAVRNPYAKEFIKISLDEMGLENCTEAELT